MGYSVFSKQPIAKKHRFPLGHKNCKNIIHIVTPCQLGIWYIWVSAWSLLVFVLTMTLLGQMCPTGKLNFLYGFCFTGYTFFIHKDLWLAIGLTPEQRVKSAVGH